MKQPLMITPTRIPPAQAEALYDAALTDNERSSPRDAGRWPGEDGDDDIPATYRSQPPPGSVNGRVAQH